MQGHTVHLRGLDQRSYAKRLIDAAPANAIVNIREAKRTNEQNAKMWALLSELSAAKPEGRVATPEVWKCLFMHALGHQSRFEMGLDGQPFPIGFSSSNLTKAQMSDLIELIYEYGARHGVEFMDPPNDEPEHAHKSPERSVQGNSDNSGTNTPEKQNAAVRGTNSPDQPDLSPSPGSAGGAGDSSLSPAPSPLFRQLTGDGRRLLQEFAVPLYFTFSDSERMTVMGEWADAIEAHGDAAVSIAKDMRSLMDERKADEALWLVGLDEDEVKAKGEVAA